MKGDDGWRRAGGPRTADEGRLPDYFEPAHEMVTAHGKKHGETPNALQKAWIRAGFPRDPTVLQTLVERATGVDGDLLDP